MDAKTDAPVGASDELNMASISGLLDDLRKVLSSDFRITISALDAKLDRIQATVSDHGQTIASLELNANLHDERLLALETSCATLTLSNAKLLAEVTDLESRSRRNNIRIVGLPESIEGPRPSTFFPELLVEVFGEGVLDSPLECDRAHRSLAEKPKLGQRPRPVIICLHRYQQKEMIIREARAKRLRTRLLLLLCLEHHLLLLLCLEHRLLLLLCLEHRLLLLLCLEHRLLLLRCLEHRLLLLRCLEHRLLLLLCLEHRLLLLRCLEHRLLLLRCLEHRLLLLLCLEQEFEVQCVTFQMSGPQIVPDKQAVVMNCSHDDSSLYVMLWYLQRRGVGGSLPLVLLGSNYAGTSNYQEGFEERFEIQMTDRLRGALVLREAAVADTAVYFCAASVINCVTFQPSHPIILRENARVEIKCEHDDSDFNMMLWYRQQRPSSNLLSLICYNYVASDPTYEAEFKGRFEMRRESVTRGTLVRLRAEANDSGEYFCAGMKKGAKEIQIVCSHDDSDYRYMSWYRRRDDHRLFERQLNRTRLCTSALPELAHGLAAVPAPIQSGDLMLHPGVNVTLHCSLASDIRSHIMLWYRQHVYGEPVQFIVNEYNRRQGRFQATLETEQNRFLLEIAELQLDDSGTYYCAAYHSEGPG
ncbi:hypothetical protein NHX12_019384 [Muraenolepis orangiensis]|uniref:Ig-like domain-containing protein n=1 Tax=Muraenolepis orangiensis TaxID=630683 RepID=A0A9Q0ET46_9TELE|nr:hypothetical protein NHX12_019384 [Muraenolepis orangiensis]